MCVASFLDRDQPPSQPWPCSSGGGAHPCSTSSCWFFLAKSCLTALMALKMKAILARRASLAMETAMRTMEKTTRATALALARRTKGISILSFFLTSFFFFLRPSSTVNKRDFLVSS